MPLRNWRCALRSRSLAMAGLLVGCILIRMSGECLRAQPVDANEGVKRGLLAGSIPQLSAPNRSFCFLQLHHEHCVGGHRCVDAYPSVCLESCFRCHPISFGFSVIS
jgi:hypothetical protein